jgi:adenylosuccinate synthase
MPATVVIGAQWGDEGKGKVVDALSATADAVVRFQGGANAGHTLVINDRKIVLHVLPCGVVREGLINMIGPEVMCDLEALIPDLDIAREFGSRVLLERATPVVLPIHKLIDGGREKSAGRNAIGTTKRGIGPATCDFVSRNCIKLGDLVSRSRIEDAMSKVHYDERIALAEHLGIRSYPSERATVEWLFQYSDQIRPLISDTRRVVLEMMERGRNILFEGAQGVLLDRVHGSQPFTTSSCCTPAGVSASFGIFDFEEIYGVAKADVTRVGEGPFPTELFDATGELLRTKGGEFGATTGRPRRCGWLDLVALRFACRMAGITKLIITKLDVFSGFKEIKVCDGYRFEGEPLGKYETLTARVLRESIPVFHTVPGWQAPLTSLPYQEFPIEAKEYLARISAFTKVPVVAVGTGPEREQYVECRVTPEDPF